MCEICSSNESLNLSATQNRMISYIAASSDEDLTDDSFATYLDTANKTLNQKEVRKSRVYFSIEQFVLKLVDIRL